jgi:integrase/recombinase XerD
MDYESQTLLLNRLRDECALRGYSQKTSEAYAYVSKEYFKFLCKTSLNISHETVKGYILALDLGINSCRLHYAALRFLFKRVLKSPFTLEEIPIKKREKRLPKVISRQDIIKMINSTSNLKHRLVIQVLYSSGMRLSELLNLKRADLDFDTSTIRINKGKGKKDRIALLADTLKTDLLKYLSKTEFKTNYLFEGRKGRYSTKSIQLILKKSLDKAVSPHMLRHSFATHLFEQGIDIYAIKSLLGHGSVKTTQIYTKLSKLKLNEIENPLDKLRALHSKS